MSPDAEREILTQFLLLDADIIFSPERQKHGSLEGTACPNSGLREPLKLDSNRFIGFAGTFLFLMELHSFTEDTNDGDYWAGVFKTRHKDKGTFSSRIACLDTCVLSHPSIPP
jgi:hypothetical protein